MSLETSIAALTTQAGLLLDLPQQVATSAQAQIALVGAEYTNRIAGLAKDVWLDAVVGLDTNPGTEAQPVKTIGKAVSMVPPGGRVTITLLSDYELTADTPIQNRQVLFRSSGVVRRQITFGRYSWVTGATTYSAVRSFWLWDGATIEFDNVKIYMPPQDGAWLATTAVAWAGIRVQSPTRLGAVPYVGLYNSDIAISGTPYAPIFDRGGAVMAVTVMNCIVSGQALNGRLFADATSTAGTAAGGLSWLLTNLATI